MAIKLGAGVSTLRPVLFFFRFMQWASAVIVMGIASSYIHKYNPEGEHIVYAEVIVSLPFSGPITPREELTRRQGNHGHCFLSLPARSSVHEEYHMADTSS
jgi:hypothetical protein